MVTYVQAFQKLAFLKDGAMEDAQPWEIEVVRDLAKKYMENCESEKNLSRIRLWNDFNDLKDTRPLVTTIYQHAAKEIVPVLGDLKTKRLRQMEGFFLWSLWHFENVHDDCVLRPFVMVKAIMEEQPGFWGVTIETKQDPVSKGWASRPAIRCEEDLSLIRYTPHHVLDANPPLAVITRELIGDIVPVHIRRIPKYRFFGEMDLSLALLTLLGYEEFLWMMYEEPELVHKLMGILSRGIIESIDACRDAGDWAACDMFNYAELNTGSLPPVLPNIYTSDEKKLWWFAHGQEFDIVSPDMFKEFLLDYQRPIMERFALSSYGCCEDLLNKMPHLRQVKNLRRVGVGPKADINRNIDAIGKDYIISWRPFPHLVNTAYNPEGLRKQVRSALDYGKGTHIEIILKDILTFDGHPERLVEATRICMEEALSI